MSDHQDGPGWWQASDGRWYPPERGEQPTRAFPAYPQPSEPEQPRWWKKAVPMWGVIAISFATMIFGAAIGTEREPEEDDPAEVAAVDDTTTTREQPATTEPAPQEEDDEEQEQEQRAAPVVTSTTKKATTTTRPRATTTTKDTRPRMPDVVCRNLQDAQNDIQRAGVFLSYSEDATGQGRNQIVDSNWIVIRQTPRPGTPFGEGDATLYVVRTSEENDC